MMRKAVLLASAAAGLSISGLPARAQPSSPASPPAEDGALEQVVVTAQRTETALQKTPIAVTAYNAAALTQKGVANLLDLSAFAPNLSIVARPGAGANRASFAIRGIGVNSEQGSSSVGVYVDEVYFPSGWGNALGLLDTERVEILRGPQGTLFGRNTIAGAVQYVSVKPSRTFGGYAQATGGAIDRTAFEGAVNVPLGDTLAVRFSLSHDKQGGYVVDDLNGVKRGGLKTLLGRLQVRWTPTDKLTLDLKTDYARQRSNGRAVSVIGVNPLAQLVLAAGATTFLPPPAPFGAFTSTLNNSYISTRKYHIAGFNDPDYFRSQQRSYAGTLSYDLSDAIRFKSITAYQDDDNNSYGDFDMTPVSILAGSRGRYEDTLFSQEFQLTGRSLEDRLTWTAGAYYFDGSSKKIGQFSDIGASGQFIVPLANLEDKTKSKAVYAQASFKLTPQLTANGGIRYSREKITSFNLGGVAPLPSNLAVPTPYQRSATFNDTSPQIGINYQIADDAMLYVKASKGFRAGGFALNEQLVQAGGAVVFAPETAWTYEAGLRLELLNRRLRLNPTVFWTDWSNIQINNIRPTPQGLPAIVSENAGDARIKGVEAEAQWAVTPRLLLTGSLGYLNSRYTRVGAIVYSPFPYVTPTGAALQVPDLLLDTPLQQAPKWKYSLGARYTQPVAGGAQVVASADYGWTDAQQSASTRSQSFILPSYGLLNGRVTYVAAGGKWSLSIYGTNLTNKYYWIGAAGFGAGYTIGVDEADVGRPREYGVTLRASF